jgi:hypothetical protein
MVAIKNENKNDCTEQQVEPVRETGEGGRQQKDGPWTV